MTLTDFLLARIAEDEAAAEDAVPVGWVTFRQPDGSMSHTSVACREEEGWLVDGRMVQDDHAEVFFDPARVLAECEAKRRIVELHVPDRALENWYWSQRKCSECGGLWHVITPFAKPTDIGAEQGCRTLRALALPYADHPDYREEWKL